MEEWVFHSAFRSHFCTRPLFRGTFASDEIGREKLRPGLFIINTAPRSSDGEHWVLCHVDKVISYCDSYGLKPFFPEFFKFLGKCPEFVYNKKRLQGPTSTTCGHYCLYLGARLACGIPLQDATSKFSSITSVNDRAIFTLVRKEFPIIGLRCCSSKETKEERCTKKFITQ